MSDPLLPDLADVPDDDDDSGQTERHTRTPDTDPAQRESEHPAGEEHAKSNRETENPT